MDKKLENILQQTGEIFLKYGIRSVSMDDICKELVISKKTLYQYVANKKELIKMILDLSIEVNIVDIWKSREMELNAIDVLLKISRELNAKFSEHNTSAIFDLEKYYPDLYRDFLQKRREVIHERIKNNLKEGIKQDLYRDDLDVELVALLYVKKLEDITSTMVLSDKKISFSQIFEVMFENHIRGISNKAGIDYFEKKKANLNLNPEEKIGFLKNKE